jgi:HK97 family phage prohead protease
MATGISFTDWSSQVDYEAKDFSLKITEVKSDDGTNIATFEGYASIYGNTDGVGDIVAPGAFKRTLEQNDSQTVLLWQHEKADILGIGKLEDTEHGLKIHGELNLEVGKAREALALIKQGAVKGMSIGYNTIQHAWQGTNRLLKELRLKEVSLVTFPANEYATVTQVKSMQFARHMQTTQISTLPILTGTSDWDEAKAAVRVMQHFTEEKTDWDAYGQAFVWTGELNGKKAFRGLIADVVDGELKAIPQGIYAAAADVESDEKMDDIQRRFMRGNLEPYFDELKESPPWGTKTGLFDAWLFQGLGMAVETKYGKILSNRNSQLVAQVRDQLSALLDTANPPEPDSVSDHSDDDEEDGESDSADKAGTDYEAKTLDRILAVTNQFQIGVDDD